MKNYTLLFRVGPPAMFGLPQDGTVVVPAKNGASFVGPVLDSRSGQLVSHGTLSEYRADEEAVKFSGTVAGFPLEVHDNFFRLQVEAGDRRSALREGTTALEQLLRLLSIEYGNSFSYEVLQIESDDGELEVRPGPKMVELIRATIFNTGALADRIQAAAGWSRLDDPRLSKALLYHEHAAFLFELRTRVGFFSPHFAFLLTSAFLNMWKAITTILGEPGVDTDYQSRFLTFGLPEGYWQDQVKPLKEVRNAFDVAHYSLDQDAIDRVEKSFGLAGRVCREAIKAYVTHLAGSTSPPNNGLNPSAAGSPTAGG